MAPRYVPPHKRGVRRAAAAGSGMEPEEEIAEAEVGEQRRLGTARRVSARTPRADSVYCRREVQFATVAGFFPQEAECWGDHVVGAAPSMIAAMAAPGARN